MIVGVVTNNLSFIFNNLNKNIQGRQIKKENVKALMIAIMYKVKRIN